ncbi:MAG: DUF1501 domain-containing protein [Planctomycetaceae bacterium]|nr:DUF1501 domain-containing protein [Planctomycetaceae bacterium]
MDMHAASLLTRRRLLQFSGTGLGLHLGGLWQAAAAQGLSPRGDSPIRSCILVFYYGGPSQLETFDPKPLAPKEVRGEFQPIATSAPGVFIGEHLPHLAKWMHKAAIVRSVTHQARLHDSASIHALTGRPLAGPDRELFEPTPQFYPSYGSVVAHLRTAAQCDVPFAALPFPFRNVHEVPCQGGCCLGAAYDPIWVDVQLNERRYAAELLHRTAGVDERRLNHRRLLLDELDDRRSALAGLNGLYDKAYRLLESDTIAKAVDITAEPASVRDRYGFDADPMAIGVGGGGGNGAEMAYARQMRGQNLLLARRLVEAGVPFVNVHDCRQQGQNWDAHFQCADQHRKHLLPIADRSLSALIEDLDARGLLDSTLIVAMGEFGRTPTINAQAGRDHWPDCYSVLLVGGGVKGGSIYGASDRLAAYPDVDPVTPGDLAATIFWRFGLDPATEIRDRTGQPHRLAAGEPLKRLFERG